MPFGVVGKVDDRREIFLPSAFDEFLSKSPNVHLNFPDHDSPPYWGIWGLFRGRDGLFFGASIRATLWRQIQSQGECRCSIGGVRLLGVERRGGADVITRAHIEHVTITPRNAVYPDTGVWGADGRQSLSPRLRGLDERWADAKRRSEALATIDTMRQYANVGPAYA